MLPWGVVYFGPVVNHKAPSGPAVIATGTVLVLGTGYSAIVAAPAGSPRQTPRIVANATLLAIAQAMSCILEWSLSLTSLKIGMGSGAFRFLDESN